MIVFPNAKINIGLRVTRIRPDGYHDIETVFYPVGLGDALEFVDSDSPDNKDVLTITGIDPGCKPDDNLVFKAILKLRKKKYFPFLKVHLHKAIPVGAGLGGGSSDAAWLLKAINRYYGLRIDNGSLRDLASELGSDCSFFIEGVPSIASGRGEILTSVKQVLAGYYLVIIHPGVGISTSDAYKNCIPGTPSMRLEQLINRPVIEWKELVLNDFEYYAFKKFPVIGNMKEEMYRSGALFSLMSGSGSSVYGIFPEKPTLPEKIRNFVIWEGML